ncbi:hypothetical protein AMS68_002805 [Peltaster fructicola]|uniref:DM2 domain-containing protein n=1 Tax=Peltaster fructicola TaxID=286661 RepID=A0A6H0XRM0_9PEZI|nr:hypothetical protein AMS68_002805 [Peltaster fructicola]
MQGYRNVSRRGPGPIAPPAQAPQQIMTRAHPEDQHQELLRREKMKRSSRKPTDRQIPDELSGVVVGDGVQRNTADGQPWQVVEDGSGLNADGTFDFGDENSSATYRVKVEGRLLGNGEEEAIEKDEKAAPVPKFSSFFRSITVDYQRNPDELEPDGFAQIGWQKQQPSPQNPTPDLTSKENSFDLLEFERKGDENINVTINLVRDLKSERYRLSPPLAELLDTAEDDMTGIIQGIWEYARARNLQEDDDKRSITCDEALQRVFYNKSKIDFPQLPELLIHHLQPLPPIKLNYTIRVDKAYISPSDSTPASQPTIYDIHVPLPNTLTPVLSKFHSSKSHVDGLKGIIDMDSDIALLVAKINQTNAKRKFFENLSKEPAGFIQRWMGSQNRDLEVILAEATRGGGEDGEQWRKGGKDGVWGSEIARESVSLWLARSGRY